MTFDVQTIFLPSVGVDIVFNINSLAPYSRSSIIYDTDFKNCHITVAQTITPLNPNTQFTELHLTTIIQRKNRKLRVAVPIERFRTIPEYRLANSKHVEAIEIKYGAPASEMNIRSAFRLPLNTKFILKGKIFYQNLEFITPRDFSIRDISLTGLGLVIPKKNRSKRENPLLSLQHKDELKIGVILINMEKEKPMGTIPIKVKVCRINNRYSETHCLVGLKITAIKPEKEDLLNKFIHAAQVDELKRLSGRDS